MSCPLKQQNGFFGLMRSKRNAGISASVISRASSLSALKVTAVPGPSLFEVVDVYEVDIPISWDLSVAGASTSGSKSFSIRIQGRSYPDC